MSITTQEIPTDFVYSCEIVPLARLLGQEDRIWLFKAYLHHPEVLKLDLPAIKEAVESRNPESLRSILRKYRPQDEPPIAVEKV